MRLLCPTTISNQRSCFSTLFSYVVPLSIQQPKPDPWVTCLKACSHLSHLIISKCPRTHPLSICRISAFLHILHGLDNYPSKAPLVCSLTTKEASYNCLRIFSPDLYSEHYPITRRFCRIHVWWYMCTIKHLCINLCLQSCPQNNSCSPVQPTVHSTLCSPQDVCSFQRKSL